MNGPSLRDIHLPPASWWPPAQGWWWIAGFIVLGCAALTIWIARRHRRGPLRAALRELDTLAAAHAEDGDDALLADAASRLMRRVARRVDPAAATRSGTAWREFVQRYARDAGTRAALDRLLDERYRTRPALDPSALFAALRAWCRNALGTSVSRTRPVPPAEAAVPI